ncbi:hypothetical protein V3851_08560 [Paenibacillus sp. M1]|uniref:SMI1/KNR4 family protein n=1 Tax=Paenibacillus haidiansis TaxID=1574488 RepID=A0ABU7VR75_9BACL
MDRELQKEYGLSVDDYIGFYISFNSDIGLYECTPEDAVVFGRTGVNGDHFAFYTFNRSIVDLEEAPILFIQPTAFGNEVNLVAKNLKEFLALFIALKELYVLERFRFYKNKSEFIKEYKEIYLKDIGMRDSNYNYFIKRLMEKIEGIPEINDVYEYIIELRKQNRLE